MIVSTLGIIQNVLLTMHENRPLQNHSIFYGGKTTAGTDPLVVKLQHLRRRLRKEASTTTTASIDATELVVPFVDIVHAEQCSGIIKASALSALHHFIVTGMITQRSTRISPAINAAAYAAINCRFEVSDSGSDEVVLHAVLSLVTTLLDSKGVGAMLTDEVVWGISQAAFSLAFTHHRSLLLRQQSERALKNIMHHVFSRLGDMLAVNSEANNMDRDGKHGEPSKDGEPSTSMGKEYPGTPPPPTKAAASTTTSASTYRPHGLPVAVKLFNFAMQLVDGKSCALFIARRVLFSVFLPPYSN
jgi:hypothetical protein